MLDEKVKSLAQGKNFAAFTTLLPSGQPMTHVMWVDADDEHLLINTEVHRHKFLNVTADPRVTVMVIDAAEPLPLCRGAGPGGRICHRARSPRPYRLPQPEVRRHSLPADTITSERVILRIAPERQRLNS